LEHIVGVGEETMKGINARAPFVVFYQWRWVQHIFLKKRKIRLQE